jgi:hypothetical protein
VIFGFSTCIDGLVISKWFTWGIKIVNNNNNNNMAYG